MIQRIFVFSILFITIIANAQTDKEYDIDQLTSDFIKDLQSKKIDTICVYENYCVGCELTYDTSKIFGEETCTDELKYQPAYVFWKEKGITFLTKINTCFQYSGSIVSKNNFWDIYFSNKDLIQKEVIKPFEYKILSNKNKQTSTLKTSHSCFQVFKMMNKNGTTIKVFDHFKLKKINDTFSNKTLYNINYEHNINLKSKLIIDILEKTTSEAEKNNIFKKTKSR
ncbi:hypothetical protein [Flavobacterium sp. PS2]|uniref:hypothetical protein n=1 Tax=Flavobacterium sp. PS2 TaxID=3384157 RepID=UPI00390C9918